jgi:pantoate--beta-alanine ligase
MRLVRTVEEMKAVSREQRALGKRIGLVPTMGSLHEGHLSLVRECRAKADVTVVSIFVNPAQFGPGEDLASYPRDLERDAALLEKEGVDHVFHPEPSGMYPEGFRTFVEVRDLQDRLCGRSRPGHFRGVCTVVLKLFNIVRPDVAFFGWKDAQQVIILRKMAADLDLDIRIEALPMVRDADGLALSSRNSYLSAEERKAARVLSRSLEGARRLVEAGETDAGIITERIREAVAGEPLARLDYVEVADPKDLGPVDRIEGEVLVALAVFIGRTRLIDNVRIAPALGREPRI